MKAHFSSQKNRICSVRTNTPSNSPDINSSEVLMPLYVTLNYGRLLKILGHSFPDLYRQACWFVLFVCSPCFLLRVRAKNVIFFENTFPVREHRGSSLDNQIPNI